MSVQGTGSPGLCCGGTEGTDGLEQGSPSRKACCLALGGRAWGEIHGSWSAPQLLCLLCLSQCLRRCFSPFPLSDYHNLKTGRIHIKTSVVLTQPTLTGIALSNRDLKLWRWDLLERNQVVQLPALGPCPAPDGPNDFGVES